MTIDQYIEEVVAEWKGKTISSSEHFADELRVALLRMSIFTQRQNLENLEKAHLEYTKSKVSPSVVAPPQTFTCRRCKDWTANSHELCNDCMQEVSD